MNLNVTDLLGVLLVVAIVVFVVVTVTWGALALLEAVWLRWRRRRNLKALAQQIYTYGRRMEDRYPPTSKP